MCGRIDFEHFSLLLRSLELGSWNELSCEHFPIHPSIRLVASELVQLNYRDVYVGLKW